MSADRLIDQLWGDEPPATAAKSVQVHVSRLRKELGEGRLVTRAPGYLLQVEPSELDLARFERLLGDARGADPEEAGQKLREALALWRGNALADLAYEPFAQIEIARLEELRQAALEQRIDAHLAAGRHSELVGELEVLVVEHPLRERLRCQLLLALYRSGRQAEALEAYRAGRAYLSEELGLEPSEELRQLEQAILRHDPALDLAQEPPAAPEVAPIDRSILLVPKGRDALDPLLRLAQPLAASTRPHELIIASVVEPATLGAATAALAGRRDELLADGLAVRTAAFASLTPARDIVRVASQQDVDLLLMDATESPLEGDAGIVLEQATCDVALLVQAGGTLRSGPVVLPFGAAWHDWAALELGACVARAVNAPLRLIGAASEHRDDGRDASPLLADASHRAEERGGRGRATPREPRSEGHQSTRRGAGLLVVGLSERWRQEGLGRVRTALVEAPPAPMVLVRRGPRPGGLAPADTRTRFGWSLTASPP